MTSQSKQAILERPKTVIVKKAGKKITKYIEKNPGIPLDKQTKADLQALLDRETPLPTVVVKCNRNTGMWQLFQNDQPWKELSAAILVEVRFSCEWEDGKYLGCGNSRDGEYIGYAAGKLLPVSTPVSVPSKGVSLLRFDVDDGKFYDPATGNILKGSGYLILKPGCSSEYVNSKAIKAQTI